MNKTIIATAVTFAVASLSTQAMARDSVWIAGSSTVFPFSTAVAETFGRESSFPTPKVESLGTGGGFKLFCSGVGVDKSDISNASRAMKKSEFDQCQANGVTEITEVKIGYDGIAIANAKTGPALNITLGELWMALAKDVPNEDGKLVPNPYKKWSEINKDLPDVAIEVLGPPPTSGTRDAFVELAMEGGCDSFDSVKALAKTDKDMHKAVCHGIREDGAFIEAGENDNLIVQKLIANPNAVGVFGFSFLDQNADTLQGAKIGGVEPTFETIGDGSYPVSRSIYFYVKNAHVGTIPGIQEYVVEFTNDKAWGPDGYLADKGLIALPDEMRASVAEQARALKPMAAPAK
ncbi:PstS family phosphate ABC transporter substrate-binding protein [Thiocapsa sp. UBA6158]|jgi:phosphate transport system substrate-binding protein|uniref:PstS family phosphate ABC transporter substrate-binding protein n=1 Tax=Thiocapsa sp. UBA6158 TaxID=1947692 RepID=UPI0025EA0545|nr:PstS family phosphate ABC transporter substrate-binding protein [Thiocapsa sp. UBA6158]